MTAARVTRRRCVNLAASLKGSLTLAGELRLGLTGEADAAIYELQREIGRLLRVVSAVRRGERPSAKHVPTRRAA